MTIRSSPKPTVWSSFATAAAAASTSTFDPATSAPQHPLLYFVDEALFRARGGNGGNGCMAFRREKFVPRGGPSGGDGGHGGSVYLQADSGLNTLYHLRHRSHYAAERGRHGEGSNRTGRSGADLVVPVPLGTQVLETEQGEDRLLGELLSAGERLLVAKGGRGGRGNARFVSSVQRAPRRADPGGEGEQKELRLELKLLADAGLIGLPNAGKSTLIRRISAAQPKVADYPFTTLVPQLGVVVEGPEIVPYVVADLPGLIAGAAEGAGLGTRFLRHIERCRVLVQLVDLAALEGSAAGDLEAVEGELEAFDPEFPADRRHRYYSSLKPATSTARSTAFRREPEP